MAASDHTAYQGVENVTREMLVAAYPEKDSSWIGEQVATAGQRIDRATQALPSTAAGARRLSDAVINRAAPRQPSTPRVLIGVGLTLIGLVVLAIVERRWVAEAAISSAGIGGLLTAVAVTGVGTIVSYARSRRETVMSCRVRIDAPFSVGETVRLTGDRAIVADPGLVVVRIKNTGGTPIDPEDYFSPLGLHFPGRKVVSVAATDFDPPVLQRVLNRLPDFTIEQDRMRLPTIGIDREHSFKLVIALSGTKTGETYPVLVEGGLRQGRITTREDKEKIRPDTLVWGGLTAICVGAFAMVLLLNNITPVI